MRKLLPFALLFLLPSHNARRKDRNIMKFIAAVVLLVSFTTAPVVASEDLCAHFNRDAGALDSGRVFAFSAPGDTRGLSLYERASWWSAHASTRALKQAFIRIDAKQSDWLRVVECNCSNPSAEPKKYDCPNAAADRSAIEPFAPQLRRLLNALDEVHQDWGACEAQR